MMKSLSRKFRIFGYVFLDVIVASLAALIALLVTHGHVCLADVRTANLYMLSLALNAALLVTGLALFRIYQGLKDYVGMAEGIKITYCTACVTVFHGLVLNFLPGMETLASAGYIMLFMGLLFLGIFLLRFYKRMLRSIRSHLSGNHDAIPVMIVGAGNAGVTLLRELQNSDKIHYVCKCLADDDPNKIGTYLMSVKVEGDRTSIPALVQKYGIKEIYIAMPSCDTSTIHEIAAICGQTKCRVKTLPGLYQLVNDEVSLRSLREVSIEELLGRKAVKVDLDKIMGYVSDRVVMVTGGGGSIGSELCRQIAAHQPKRLIIVDIYENNAYDIQQELIKTYPALDLVTLIASVRDEKRMERIFATYHPELLYHAAAHKHVPLMEESPNEAIKNNVFGTLKTARLADKYHVKKFVLISTDKAVNPTNVMGATKRMCEMIVQSLNKTSETEFVAVRFGNVLGSNGSVVPLFKKQIAAGGPVQVTHPEIIRYFMTIPEAVSLVIQAGAYAHGGEIFVLDMGKPVKILTLAENLIRLSGFEPYKDIDIQFTGLRPGEKLYEEMLMSEEGLQETENKLIHIGKPIDMDETEFFAQLEELKRIIDTEPINARRLISGIVPTYSGDPELMNI